MNVALAGRARTGVAWVKPRKGGRRIPSRARTMLGASMAAAGTDRALCVCGHDPKPGGPEAQRNRKPMSRKADLAQNSAHADKNSPSHTLAKLVVSHSPYQPCCGNTIRFLPFAQTRTPPWPDRRPITAQPWPSAHRGAIQHARRTPTERSNQCVRATAHQDAQAGLAGALPPSADFGVAWNAYFSACPL